MRAHVDAAVAKGWIGPVADGPVHLPVVAIETEVGGNNSCDGVGLAVQDAELS